MRIIKIGLIVLTGYFYTETLKSNSILKNSITGISSSSAQDRFQRDYRNYQIAGALTIFTFSFSAFKAYLRFGKNEKMQDLEIENRTIVSLDDYLRDSNSLNFRHQNNAVELIFSKVF